MLEARVHVGVEPQRHNDRVVVAVNVRIDTEETLDELAHGGLEALGEVNACLN